MINKNFSPLREEQQPKAVGTSSFGCPPHFPEYIYQWEKAMRPIVGEYHAHCAKCGTDYQLTDYKVVKE